MTPASLKTRPLFTAAPARWLLIGAAALALAACGRDDGRTVGQQIDSAVAKTERSIDKAGTETRQGVEQAKAAVEQSTQQAINNANAAVDKAAQAATDARITSEIHGRLAKDSSLSTLRINVDTEAGRVTLQGDAPSVQARDRASQLAATIEGVKPPQGAELRPPVGPQAGNSTVAQTPAG
jgi:vacuolar-type H+-ATPase subunit H